MSQADVEALRATLDSFFAGDIEAGLKGIHPDCVVREADSLPFGGEWKGPDGFFQFFMALANHFAFEVHSSEFFDGGDVVFGRYQTTFTAHATQKSAPVSILELYRLQDGKIAEIDVYFKDTHAVLSLLDSPCDD